MKRFLGFIEGLMFLLIFVLGIIVGGMFGVAISEHHEEKVIKRHTYHDYYFNKKEDK